MATENKYKTPCYFFIALLRLHRIKNCLITFTINIFTKKIQFNMSKIAIAIHGGAGTILPKDLTSEKEAAYKAALNDALTAGYAVLEKGGSLPRYTLNLRSIFSTAFKTVV